MIDYSNFPFPHLDYVQETFASGFQETSFEAIYTCAFSKG